MGAPVGVCLLVQGECQHILAARLDGHAPVHSCDKVEQPAVNFSRPRSGGRFGRVLDKALDVVPLWPAATEGMEEDSIGL